MNSLNEKIDFFFRKSTEAPTGENFSSLYLLRRDIFTCFGYNPTTMAQIDSQALWPGVMGILAGIDLLGKYLEGDDILTTVSNRFKNYYKKYINRNQDCEIIYQLRNSMLHSFGLYSFNCKIENKVKSKKQEYFFILDRRDDNLVVTKHVKDIYTINIIALCNAFEVSINRFYTDIKSNYGLQINFEKMFKFYAGISTKL